MNTDNPVYGGSAHTLNDPLLDLTDDIIRKELCQKNIKRLWSEKESSLLSEYIRQGMSPQDITEFLNRSESSIISKANRLGFSCKTNGTHGRKYFIKNINFKQKRTKKKSEIMKESKPILQEGEEKLGIEVASDIIINVGEILMKAGLLLKSHTRTNLDNSGGVS